MTNIVRFKSVNRFFHRLGLLQVDPIGLNLDIADNLAFLDHSRIWAMRQDNP
ncbi:hypothetical protein NG799_17945 [Laspinema sp. D1]|uniref:Uncharacterized protein n=1 Tax=Laspinema palackyanum D2a TaxID=2953684 RepID=A0ABT2MTZ6_9CYAN|nr:hypothetical protein [Laspinema sp. D2a]